MNRALALAIAVGIHAVPARADEPTADAWARVQAYLPALAGSDHEYQYQLVAAYAPSSDADAYWRRLAEQLAADHGGLAQTCAGATTRFVALLIDDPATTMTIGRTGADVRVFWIPLARIAGLTVDQAIRAAGLVDGPNAELAVRALRRGRSPAAWIDAVMHSDVWFLPVGDDLSIHHRRIRGYAVATLAQLRSRVVYVETNTLGDYCDLATTAIDRLDGIAAGGLHSGADVICALPGARELAECAP